MNCISRYVDSFIKIITGYFLSIKTMYIVKKILVYRN